MVTNKLTNNKKDTINALQINIMFLCLHSTNKTIINSVQQKLLDICSLNYKLKIKLL